MKNLNDHDMQIIVLHRMIAFSYQIAQIHEQTKNKNVYLKRAGICAWYPRDALVSCRRGDGDGVGSG